MQRSYKTYLKDITTFVFDVDGVLTDGTVLISTKGDLLRSMSVKDGYAIKTAIDKGYVVCIISGGSNEGVR
ncbi:MAG: 3-deoxy-D-manno-octulosonate 8-phosphate phosphatase, partial [Flavobacteriaceae bacterium]